MCTGGLNMRISNSHIRTGQELHDSSHTLQQHVWSCSTSCLHTILMTGRYSFCIQWLFIIAETLQKLGDCQALNPYQQVFWWILKKSGLGFCVCVCVCVFFGWGALGCQPGKHSDMVTSKILWFASWRLQPRWLLLVCERTIQNSWRRCCCCSRMRERQGGEMRTRRHCPTLQMWRAQRR
jgi:hypothetical protein